LTDNVLAVVTIPPNHQITIPKRVMQTFNLKEKDTVEFVNKDGVLILRKQVT
jgi:AbrB family looped-hinge helix DNA binding protein